MVLFATFTNISLINVCLVWIELASSVMTWITQKFILKSSNILFLIGVSYLTTMVVLVVVGQNYAGAAMMSFGVAIIIILGFLYGGRILAKKLEIRRPIQVKPNKQAVRQFALNEHLTLNGEVKNEIVEKRGPINQYKGLLKTMSNFKMGRSVRIAPGESASSIQNNQLVKDEVLISEGAKCIMTSARIIAGIGCAYCCGAVIYSIFSDNVPLGIVSALAQLFMCLNGIFVNGQVLRYIMLSKQLSYHVKIQSSKISTGQAAEGT